MDILRIFTIRAGSTIMKNLESVTLCIVDTVNTDDAYRVLLHSIKHINFGDILFFTDKLPTIQIPDEPWAYRARQIRIHKIEQQDWHSYSNFVLFNLVDYIRTAHVLICQTDGFILNPHLWTDDFLQYDYIGAKWRLEHLQGCEWIFNHIKQTGSLNTVGNGGFSLRSKKLLQYAKESGFECPGPEDAFICNNHYDYFVQKGIKFAPENIADVFAKEQNESLKYEEVFGFHGNKHLINTI